MSATLETLFMDMAAFLDQGGPVMWLIALTSALLWALLAERTIYLFIAFPRFRTQLAQVWQQLTPASVWVEQKLRERLVSITRQRLERNQPAIRVLVAICPLLGLLGTVTGMLTVFDVLAFTGTGNARAMADGVSRATLPTLAGMVVSLTGLLATLLLTRLTQRAERQATHLLSESPAVRSPDNAYQEVVAHA
ncbi:MotA/TolQ/ExbB proton channel family protein [Marinobacter sp. HN1S83]|uniref:MotA/TolQ/ExbB proton channel family protein n=1 Tax=Marinobacter sp. HN1S83 TaxID=3382301 RepID=UPI00387B772F